MTIEHLKEDYPEPIVEVLFPYFRQLEETVKFFIETPNEEKHLFFGMLENSLDQLEVATCVHKECQERK